MEVPPRGLAASFSGIVHCRQNQIEAATALPKNVLPLGCLNHKGQFASNAITRIVERRIGIKVSFCQNTTLKFINK